MEKFAKWYWNGIRMVLQWYYNTISLYAEVKNTKNRQKNGSRKKILKKETFFYKILA